MFNAIKRMGSRRESPGDGLRDTPKGHRRTSSKKQQLLLESRVQKEEADKQAAERVRKEEHEQIVAMKERGQEEKKRQLDEVKGKTEVSTNRVDFTQGVMGLVDRMESHPAGRLFSGAVVSNKPPPDRALTLSKLRTYQAPNDMSRLVLGDIEPIDLKDNTVDIALTEAMTIEQYKSLRPYCLISDVFIHFVPMDTFFTTSFPVDFFLNDFRKVEDCVVRHFPLSHTVGYNILFTLDYCVRKEDLKLLTLAISSGINTFRPGIAWGTVKVVVSLISMEFPIKANMQKTLGVMHLADSDLQDFVSDPRRSDGVLTPEGLKQLKAFYKRGDIENIHQPLDDSKDVNVAPTVMNHMDQSTDVAEVMRAMREAALERSRPRDSVQGDTPGSSGPSLKVKSALKVRNEPLDSGEGDDGKFPNVRATPPPSDNGMKDLNEVGIDESMSQVGSSDTETIERPFSPPNGSSKRPAHQFRQVNFSGLN